MKKPKAERPKPRRDETLILWWQKEEGIWNFTVHSKRAKSPSLEEWYKAQERVWRSLVKRGVIV